MYGWTRKTWTIYCFCSFYWFGLIVFCLFWYFSCRCFSIYTAVYSSSSSSSSLSFCSSVSSCFLVPLLMFHFLNVCCFRHLPLVFHCLCDNSSALLIFPLSLRFFPHIWGFFLPLLWYLFLLVFFSSRLSCGHFAEFLSFTSSALSPLARPRNNFALFGQLKLGPAFLPALEPWIGMANMKTGNKKWLKTQFLGSLSCGYVCLLEPSCWQTFGK